MPMAYALPAPVGTRRLTRPPRAVIPAKALPSQEKLGERDLFTQRQRAQIKQHEGLRIAETILVALEIESCRIGSAPQQPVEDDGGATSGSDTAKVARLRMPGRSRPWPRRRQAAGSAPATDMKRNNPVTGCPDLGTNQPIVPQISIAAIISAVPRLISFIAPRFREPY